MAKHVHKTVPSRWTGPFWAGMRIGLLGGSFNPAHDGHLQLSLVALKKLGLDAVWWLVSPQNPLKNSAQTQPLAARLVAAQQIACHPRLHICALEDDFGTFYTADTLTILRRYYPHCDFVWLMGADNMVQLPQWRDWNKIVATTPMAVFARPPYSLKALHGKVANRYRRYRRHKPCVFRQSGLQAWMYVAMPLNPLSSTMIRAARQTDRINNKKPRRRDHHHHQKPHY